MLVLLEETSQNQITIQTNNFQNVLNTLDRIQVGNRKGETSAKLAEWGKCCEIKTLIK